jgi:hypothetical protein
VYKKLAGERTTLNINMMDLWHKRLPKLLEGYKLWDIYDADEMGIFYNCLADKKLAIKGQSYHGGKIQGDNNGAIVA